MFNNVQSLFLWFFNVFHPFKRSKNIKKLQTLSVESRLPRAIGQGTSSALALTPRVKPDIFRDMIIKRQYSHGIHISTSEKVAA